MENAPVLWETTPNVLKGGSRYTVEKALNKRLDVIVFYIPTQI